MTFQEKSAENGCTQDNCHRSFAPMIAWDGKHCRAGVYSRRSLRRCMVGGTKAPPYDKQAKNGERRSALHFVIGLFAGDKTVKIFDDFPGSVITADGCNIIGVFLYPNHIEGETVEFLCAIELDKCTNIVGGVIST